MEVISKLIDAAKNSVSLIAALAIASGIGVLAPDEWMERLGLKSFLDSYRGWIGMVFIVSISVVAVSVVVKIVAQIKQAREDQALLNQRIERLRKLSPEEKNYLNYYISNRTRTAYFAIDDGVVQGLVHEGILYRSTSIGQLHNFGFNIQPWAWDHLSKHPDWVKPADLQAPSSPIARRSRRR